jgi:glycine/D-amino acid oxidase-like deaminating enzyme
LRGTQNMTRLAKYSADLYVKLEEETGVATGMRQVGSISLGLTADRRGGTLAAGHARPRLRRGRGKITAAEVKAMYPHVKVGDVTCAVHLPGDGQCDPANIAMALAKGARMRGCADHRGGEGHRRHHCDGKRVTGVDWENGRRDRHIAADIVINCGGMWGRDLAAQSGVTLPLHACEHFYLVTEPIEGLGHLPVLRVPDECAYYKSDAGKMMLGAFEPRAKPWGMAGIPRISVRRAARGFRTFRADPRHGHAPHADVRDGGHSHLLQRARKLHAR